MAQQLRSVLFVPATRPERFVKAMAAGADAVIIDLEDAVEHENKASARENIRQFALAHPDNEFFVRVNDATTSWFADDIALCADLPSVRSILLPKAESARQIEQAFGAGKAVLPIVESAKGVLAMAQMAAAQGVERFSFGSLDLMLDMGTTTDTVGAEILLNHIRCQVLLHSRVHGLNAPLDGVYPNFGDDIGLAQVARQVRDMGFGGMLCIHPKQIPIIHAAFAPTTAEVEWAERLLAIADASGSSAFQMDGKMVDAPVIERARQIRAQVS